MIDILEYIRSFFFTTTDLNRKKRRSTVDEAQVPVKIRKTNMSQRSYLEDEWLSSSSSSGNIKQRTILSNSLNLNPAEKIKENIIYNIDDDDVLEIKKPNDMPRPKSSHFTSTPFINGHNSLANGDDDIAIVSFAESSLDKKNNSKKIGCEYIRRFSGLHGSQNTFRRPHTTSQINRTEIDSISPTFKSIQEIKTKMNNRNMFSRSSILDQSFRLDEKLKYKELLSKAAPTISPNNIDKSVGSFSKYSIPFGKMFVDSRGKKLVNLAQNHENKEPVQYIDLTGEDMKKSRTKLSTKDTIKKVLEDFDSEPVVVKDSDSEIEIMPCPPSPKPDIKVDRVNSLKKIIDTTEPAKGEWLKQIIQKYESKMTRNQRLIQEQGEHVDKLRQINDEIRTKQLEADIRKSLQIKEVVLLVEIPKESSLPTLTEEQEDIVTKALNPRGNLNDVLVQKFNLSITRRDILTLSGLNWLNDEVINFYMNLIIERGKLSKWPKAYAMNTFFYPKLVKDGPSSLKRWTRKVDIFSYDIIAVPIHLGLHWCMSIIDFNNKVIRYYDSMGGTNRRCLDLLLNYLQFEHLDKKKIEYDVSDWELENVKDIPQQMNGSDCGMFACTYAEFLTRNAKITFSQEDMPYLRRKMVLEIITGEMLIT